MAVVYLPYGYPLQSGNAYDAIVYQGAMVRVYTLPADPRTTDQLFNRRFLADTSKVRKVLGTWGKGAGKSVFGSTWATIVYQLIKADEGGVWSDAEALWNGFSIPGQNAWRAVAPYAATYNDPGKMFYCYARALIDLLLAYGGVTWLGLQWDEGDSAAAAAWWAKVQNSEMVVGTYDDLDAKLYWVGAWWSGSNASYYNGSTHNTAIGQVCTCDFYYYAKGISIYYFTQPSNGSIAVYIDGQLVGTINQHSTPTVYGVYSSYTVSKGLHHVHLVSDSGWENVDRVDVF